MVPELRFREFEGEWKRETLGNLLSFKNGVNAEKGQYGSGFKFINVLDIIQNDFITHDVIIGEVELSEKEVQKNEVKYGDILFQRSSETREEVGQANVYLDQEKSAVFGGFVIRGRAKRPYDAAFMNGMLKTDHARKEITTKSGGSTRYNVGQETLSEVKVFIPEVPEQKKIADFLSAVDARIKHLNRKKELLEQYKKGVMQRLFNYDGADEQENYDSKEETKTEKSQSIKGHHKNHSSRHLRFKRPDGSNYPDWEEKRLGDLCTRVGYGMNAAAKPFDGTNQYLRITDIEEVSRKFDKANVTSPDGELDDKFLLQKGDLLFARTGASVGKSYLYDESDGTVYFAGFLIRFHVSKANAKFVYYRTRTSEYDKWVSVMSMRSGQPGINAEEYKSFKISIPCQEEQRKIADFLSALDKKIEAVSTQIAKTQQFKKGLLQKMFV